MERLDVTILDDNEAEFRLGSTVAYGTFDGPDEYSIDHAPDQAQFNAIAAALDRGDIGSVAKQGELWTWKPTHKITTPSHTNLVMLDDGAAFTWLEFIHEDRAMRS